MEPFLKELKSRILKEYKPEHSVLIYPVTEGRKNLVFFQINKYKQCRIFYYDVTDGSNSYGTRKYTYTGNYLQYYKECAADKYEVLLDKDNEESRLLKAAIFNKFCNYAEWWTEERIDTTLKGYEKNPTLISNLVDAGLIQAVNDLNAIPNNKDGSIKDVFGVSIKYLRAAGINNANTAKWCWENNFSPKEVSSLFKKLDRWDISGGSFSVRQLKHVAHQECLAYGVSWEFRDYCNMRSFLISEKIDVSSFPECPEDMSYNNVRRLHDKIMPVHRIAREAANKRSMQEKTDLYLETYYSSAQEFEYSDNKYSVIACKDLADLVKEGSELHHCVGSYVDSVGHGREYILFLRRNEEPDVPFFTIDVLPDKHVRQIHGKFNCNVPKELMPFIKKWAKEHSLNIENIDGVRCHV